MLIVNAPARDELLRQFVHNCFLQNIDSIKPIQGDAGLRSYFRVHSGGKTYIAMDCPPTYCSTQPFIRMADYLQSLDFSAPKIIYQDTDQGFLILEDFGNVSIKNYLLNIVSDTKPVIPVLPVIQRSTKCDVGIQTPKSSEAKSSQKLDPYVGLRPPLDDGGGVSGNHSERKRIYRLIIDLLVSLQEKDRPDGLLEYDNQVLQAELESFVQWYIPHIYKRTLKPQELEEFNIIWQNILAKQILIPASIVLRDYHVENMMYLEKRQGLKQLGLLDFQDALWGSPIYDLVSVLEDARFDVPRSEALEYLEYFAQKKELDIESILLNYHILGAQRNSRILGVFARKAARDGEMGYLQYIPRVLEYLEYDLSHATLEPIKQWLEKLR